MLDDEKEEFQKNGIGAGQPDDYDKRHAAYKKELAEAVSSVRPGSSIGYLIAELRKKYGLNGPEEGGVIAQPSSQGNWSLAEINKSRDERMAKEAEENLQKQKKAKEVQQLKGLRSRLYRAQFQMPRGFSWPESEKEILRPFEFALDREIWACFSVLKVSLRESLAYEFNLPGIEVDLARFTQDAIFHPGGEKQLLSEALSALKALLRIMKTKPEAEKPASKAEKPVVKAQPKAKDLVLPTNKKAGRQLAKLRPALPEAPAKPMTAAKSEFKSFLWTNKFRRVFGLKPLPFNAELEKAFFRLSSQYQRAIVFRFRIARPAISLKELMAGGLKRGVEELVKKAMEDLRQKVLDVRREEGISEKPFLLAQPREEGELKALPTEKVGANLENAPTPETKSAPAATVEKKRRMRVSRLKKTSLFSDSSRPIVAPEPVFQLPKNFEVDFVALASAMWNAKGQGKAWQDLRYDSALLESREALAEILPQLNKEQAKILFLRYVKGLSWKQIGPIMNLGKWQYAYGYFFRAIEIIATLLRRIKIGFSDRAVRVRAPVKPKPAKVGQQSKKLSDAERKRLKEANKEEVAQALGQISLAKIKKLLWPEGRFLESSQELASFFSRPWRRGKVGSTKEEQVFFLLVGEEDLSEKQIVQRLDWKHRAVYCAKNLILRKIKEFCVKQRKSLGLTGEMPDKSAMEVWIERVLAAELKDIEEVSSLLSQISLPRLQEAIGPDSSVFTQPEQLAPFLLQPGKHGFSLTNLRAKTFLLTFWQERIKAHQIEMKGGPSAKMVQNLRHFALCKIRVVARKIVESGISVEDFFEKALAPSAPKMVTCRHRIKTSKAKLEISLAQLGNYLVLLGLRFLSFSSEQGEVPGVKIERPAISEEPGLEKSVGVTPIKEQDEDLPLRGSSHAVRLLKSPVFRDDLGLSILPERLREILPELDKIPYFKKNKLRPVKILEMRYLGGGNGGSPLSKGKIGKILGDYTRPTVNDWLNRIFLTIRELAAEGKIKE